MIARPDIENPCESCGAEAEPDRTLCARCAAFALLAEQNAQAQDALRSIGEPQ